MTKEEAELQLMQVNAAIEQLVMGKRLTILQIGTAESRRTDTYQEISIDALIALRRELTDIINSYSSTQTVQFRSSYVEMISGKNYV